MGDIGYKRKGDSGPLYHPERDYAYITPTLMRQAIEKLDADDDSERLSWRKTNNITDAEIVAIAEALANAQRDFVNAADPISSFASALSRHNFSNFRYCVRQYLWAAIGEIFCAAWFLAVREVSVVGEDSPAQLDMAKFSAAVREFANKHKSTIYDANFMAEHLRMYNDTLIGRERELLTAYRAAKAEIVKLQDELAAVKTKRGFFTRLFSWGK